MREETPKATTLKTIISRWLFIASLLAGLFSLAGDNSQRAHTTQSTATEQLITRISTPVKSIRYHVALHEDIQQHFKHITSCLQLFCFEHRETIRFHQMQKMFSSIKKLKLALLSRHHATMRDVDYPASLT